MKWLALALALLVNALMAQTQNASHGQEPAETLGARDVATEFKLPPLKDTDRDGLRKDEQKLQVFVRAKALGLDSRSATQAWFTGETTFRNARTAEGPEPVDVVVFKGALSSELNKILARAGTACVRVESAQLSVDEPIVLSRSDFTLDLGSTELKQAGTMPYMVKIERTHDVNLRGGLFLSGTWAVLVASSHHVQLLGVAARGLEGGGVLVTNSSDVVIGRSNFHGLHAAAVMLQGDTQSTVVADNEIEGDLGSSNWNAGIVVTDRTADLDENPDNLFDKDRYWARGAPIVSRLHGPKNNVIAYNIIHGNASSGIYSDGSVSNVFAGNRIERNSKEGLCLDNGSSANVVAFNLFRGNGDRWGKSDAELKLDFVASLGRLEDGTSPAKIPAISIDNAAYNQVMFNVIDGNFGGGIKLVRTAIYNVIGLNTLTDNSAGENKIFHFFGIEAGAAKGDAPSEELDFAPSRGNEIFGNTIRGAHFSGIFFAAGSDQNDVFDNSIFGATNWAMESEIVQPNWSLNNLTNQASRNIGSGIDPALVTPGAGVNDNARTTAGTAWKQPAKVHPPTPRNGPAER